MLKYYYLHLAEFSSKRSKKVPEPFDGYTPKPNRKTADERDGTMSSSRKKGERRASKIMFTLAVVIITLGFLVKLTMSLAENASGVCWRCISFSVEQLSGERGDVPETAPDGTPMA